MRERQCLIEEDFLKQVSLHLRDGSLYRWPTAAGCGRIFADEVRVYLT